MAGKLTSEKFLGLEPPNLKSIALPLLSLSFPLYFFHPVTNCDWISLDPLYIVLAQKPEMEAFNRNLQSKIFVLKVGSGDASLY